jgi:glycosyltransferase involved in cell wall biosynthesis
MAGKKSKVVIFIVAYEAETTLKAVLERIPQELFRDYDCSILVVDDASADRTLTVGKSYQREHSEIPLTVLRNEFNQGYGGNQKVGYTHAIAEGADVVVLLHGDAQYAPEELPKLIAPVARREADAVFGSRMLEPFGALRGGMPLYKFVGNRILSTVQNRLLGTKLSEFHSGYRVYSVPFLQRLHFKLNSNDFHFDSEIIIQILNAGGRILELPIPTYYGDEICRVNGMKYAKDVVRVTLENVFHRAGVLYKRRFDPVSSNNQHYDLKLGYASSHSYTLERVPNGSRVLDIGAGPGGMAKELTNKHCAVTVVDQHSPEVPVPGVRVVVQDLDQGLAFEPGDYDILLLLDVIEHLKRPEAFLESMRENFDHSTKTLILTTPNVAFLAQRVMLLFGEFNYGKTGILDLTHTRLFTFRSLEQMLKDAGFRIKTLRGVPAPFPKVFGDGLIGRALLGLNLAAIRLNKTLFSYQIYVEAESTPTPEFLVDNARVNSGLAGFDWEQLRSNLTLS